MQLLGWFRRPNLHNLISTDREVDWEGHLQAIQDLLPVFCQANCINYLRYATWYLEKVQTLDQKHPDIHNEFLAGGFVVQTSVGTFKVVSPGMKLEQTVNRSQKSSDGTVGQTKTEPCFRMGISVSSDTSHYQLLQ